MLCESGQKVKSLRTILAIGQNLIFMQSVRCWCALLNVRHANNTTTSRKAYGFELEHNAFAHLCYCITFIQLTSIAEVEANNPASVGAILARVSIPPSLVLCKWASPLISIHTRASIRVLLSRISSWIIIIRKMVSLCAETRFQVARCPTGFISEAVNIHTIFVNNTLKLNQLGDI